MLDLGMGLDADLGIDSIKRVEILSSLSERLPDAPQIEPDQVADLATLEQVAAALAPPCGSQCPRLPTRCTRSRSAAPRGKSNRNKRLRFSSRPAATPRSAAREQESAPTADSSAVVRPAPARRTCTGPGCICPRQRQARKTPARQVLAISKPCCSKWLPRKPATRSRCST